MMRTPQVRRSRRTVVSFVVVAFALAACSGSDDQPLTAASTTTTAAQLPRVGDGVLQIGALIPVNDPTIGLNLTSSFEAAVGEINAAGGVLGREVEMFVEDEGTSTASAAQATRLLVDQGADAILGPTSSNTAVGALDAAVGAGVVTCSATASAISLDDFPDEELFFRTIPTDSLQAQAIANQAKSEGAVRVAVIHIDDAFGRPFTDAVIDALGTQPSIQVSNVAVGVDDADLENDLDLFAAAEPDTAIVLGDSVAIARFLEAIDTRDDIDVNRIIVNDAARAPSTAPVVAGLSQRLRSRIVGIAPKVVNVGDDDTAFESQVTDCVNLIALATAQGESDAPAIIASQISSVSSGGEGCGSFARCVELIADESQIAYNPPGRIIDLSSSGDPSRAFFDRFTFEPDGTSNYDSSFAVP